MEDIIKGAFQWLISICVFFAGYFGLVYFLKQIDVYGILAGDSGDYSPWDILCVLLAIFPSGWIWFCIKDCKIVGFDITAKYHLFGILSFFVTSLIIALTYKNYDLENFNFIYLLLALVSAYFCWKIPRKFWLRDDERAKFLILGSSILGVAKIPLELTNIKTICHEFREAYKQSLNLYKAETRSIWQARKCFDKLIYLYIIEGKCYHQSVKQMGDFLKYIIYKTWQDFTPFILKSETLTAEQKQFIQKQDINYIAAYVMRTYDLKKIEKNRAEFGKFLVVSTSNERNFFFTPDNQNIGPNGVLNNFYEKPILLDINLLTFNWLICDIRFLLENYLHKVIPQTLIFGLAERFPDASPSYHGLIRLDGKLIKIDKNLIKKDTEIVSKEYSNAWANILNNKWPQGLAH